MKFVKTILSVGFLLLSCSIWAKPKEKSSAHMNIVRLAPISLFYGGVGLGVSYERFIGADRKLSAYIPLHFGLRNYYLGQYDYSSAGSNKPEQNRSLLIAPGIKMYPLGQGRRVNYSIGTNVFASFGTDNGFKNFEGTNAYTSYSSVAVQQFGTMVTNGITVNLSNRLCLGLEAFLGLSFRTSLRNKETQQVILDPIEPMGGINLNLGYKF